MKNIKISVETKLVVNFSEDKSVKVEASFLVSQKTENSGVYLTYIGEENPFLCLSGRGVEVLSGNKNFRSIPSDRKDWICLELFTNEKVYVQHSDWVKKTENRKSPGGKISEI